MRTTFLLLLLSTVLVSCGGSPGKPQPTVANLQSTAEQVRQLLNEAQQSLSPAKEDKRLRAAQLLLAEGQLDFAGQLLNKLQTPSLPLRQLALYIEISSSLHKQRGNYEQALSVLEKPRLQEGLYSLPLVSQLNLSLLRAELYDLMGSHIASAQQRIYISSLLNTDSQLSNQNAIWGSLMYVPMEDVEHYLSNSFKGEYQGWLQLALIAKKNQGDLDLQVQQLEAWQQQWPHHPASDNLPGGLELIKELAANRPQQVALLLPLTGKLAAFGKAVRDGFIAARYDTLNHNGKVPRLKIYNTETNTNIIELYQQAIAEGAEMVVGPLEKQRLSVLFDEGQLAVPTLALNRINNYGQPPEQLFQFGLAPQDEARQVAEIATLENHQQALIISPKGDWGDKVSRSFTEHWQALGGTTIGHSTYSGQQDYSSSTKQVLLLQDSEDRAKRIGRLTNQPLEFSPRRRQDIDMIFMLARPQQARSLKPLLAYHYAGDLPVYGTSRLYTGYIDRQKNRDLNGIRFTDMPWVLNKPSHLHQLINTEIPHSKQYQRMYALGIDSYQLHPRLRQLQEITNSWVYGQTGALKLNSQRQIERRMLFAKISNSETKVIPTASQPVGLKLPSREGIINAEDNAN